MRRSILGLYFRSDDTDSEQMNTSCFSVISLCLMFSESVLFGAFNITMSSATMISNENIINFRERLPNIHDKLLKKVDTQLDCGSWY